MSGSPPAPGAPREAQDQGRGHGMMPSEHDETTGGAAPGDAELMARLAAGQRDALGPLHGRYASLIFHIAARTLGPDAAEEIVQDVFLTIWRKAATFDPARGDFRSWALRIAHHRVLNELRRRGRRPRVEADPGGLRLGGVPGDDPGPEESAWLDHRRAVVRAAVEALPPRQRRALSLAFLDELTQQQVADFLDLPLGTAKTRIRAGLLALRAQLAPLMAAGLVVLALLAGGLVARDRAQTARLRRDDAALRVMTSSDMVSLRLVAGPDAPAAAHGHYRHRPGVPMAIATVSKIDPAPAGRQYHLWGMYGGRWHRLAAVTPRPDGGELLVVEGPHLADAPTALRLTLEPASTPEPAAPTGPPVILWTAP